MKSQVSLRKWSLISESLVSLIPSDLVEFTDEEGYGRYLDLHDCYLKYINLKASEVRPGEGEVLNLGVSHDAGLGLLDEAIRGFSLCFITVMRILKK